MKKGECQMNYSEILNGTEYDFLKTNEHLGKHVILLGLAGSYSYGIDIETSDIDLRGITLNQKSDLIGLTQFEQYVDENTDSVIYAFNKIITLLLSCNPNTIELLGLDPEHYLYLNEPRLEIAKFEYEDIKSFSPGVSPASYYCFTHPLYDLDYEEMEDGILAAEMPDEITQKYWGVKRVVCKVSLLVDVNYENAYDVIFGTFKILKNK